MTRSPTAAAHLAELEARYEAHLAALRQHASDVAVETTAGEDAPSTGPSGDAEFPE